MKYTAAILLGLLSTVDAATDAQACLYCKRADMGASFMNTFSYCPDKENEKCIRNMYLFI